MKRLKKIQPLMIIVLILNLIFSCSNDLEEVYLEDQNDQVEDVQEFLAAVIYYEEQNGDKHAIVYTTEGDKKVFTNGKKVEETKERAPKPVTLPDHVDNPKHSEIIEGDSWTDEEAMDQTTPEAEQDSTTPEQPEDPTTTTPGEHPVAGAYYVTVNGNTSNDGLSEANAWSIEHAFTNAKAGDVIYVKAGNYGNKILSLSNAGTSSAPIRIIGYRQTPGDIAAANGSTFKYGDVIDATKMPVLEGAVIDGEGQGKAITIGRDYVEIENIAITKYKIGLQSSGRYTKIDNVVVVKVGDFNPSHSYPTGTSNPSRNYAGVGIVVAGDYTELTNSFVLNAGAEGIRVTAADHTYHQFNAVYSDNNTNPTDYYYLFANEANNNKIDNVYIERVGDLEHNGHGLCFKVAAENNHVTNTSVINTIFEFSFAGVKNNLIENSYSTKGFMVANGANYNEFRNCTVDGGKSGFSFSDWEDMDDPREVVNAGHHNKYVNCTVRNAEVGIHFHWWDRKEGLAHDNEFINCTFENLKNLFGVNRPNKNTVFKGCTVKNVDGLKTNLYNYNYDLDFQYDANTVFIDNGFSVN